MWQIDLIKKIFVSSCEMYSMQQQLLMAAETFSPVFLYYIYLRHFRSIMNYHAIMYRLPHCIHLLHGKIFTYGLFFRGASREKAETLSWHESDSKRFSHRACGGWLLLLKVPLWNLFLKLGSLFGHTVFIKYKCCFECYS